MRHVWQAREQLSCYFAKCAAVIAAVFLALSFCYAQAPASPTPNDPLSQELNKYPGLLPELGRLTEKLQHSVQFPPARTESRLLPLLPDSTVVYAAFPNYGEVAHQALNIFRQELQESPVLRDWWQHGALARSGPKVEDFLEKFYQISQYLGDEIVVSGGTNGRNPSALVVAEIRKPGLKKQLEQTLVELGGKSNPTVRVLDPQELTPEVGRPAYEPVVLVRPDFVVAGLGSDSLRIFSARLDHGSRDFVSTPFGQRAIQAYQGGATLLGAVDLHQILSQVPSGNKDDQITLQRTGFADMKYLVWEHKRVNGQSVSQAELSFTGPRHGVASWLATSSPLGSLDFASPAAMIVTSMVLTNPAQIFDEVKQLAGISNPGAFAALAQFEQAWKLSLKQDVLSYLGGELTFELDAIAPSKPVWKAILGVNDPKRLQQTLNTVLATMHLPVEQSDDNGVTYYSVGIPSSPTSFDLGYTFVDGYLIVGSSHETVAEAVRLHRSGESLAKSKKFRAALPPGYPPGASLLLYQDPFAMAALNAQRIAPGVAGYISQLTGKNSPAVFCVYGEETAVREASTNIAFDAGGILIMAAIAIPNLLRSRSAANEASAVGSIRTVNTAQTTYAVTYPLRGFAPDLATLGPDAQRPTIPSADHAGMMEASLAGASCTAGAWCTKSGFRFSATGVCRQHVCKEYVVVATPVATNTGGRSFCSTSDGVIRFKMDALLTSPISVAECRAWQPLQ